MEMTKWFDTNYHYLVPEIGPDAEFRPASTKPLDEHAEALRLGVATRPVLVGPVSFLLLAKPTVAGFSPLDVLPRLLPVYQHVLAELSRAGCDWVQLDEPCLVTDLSPAARSAYTRAYAALAQGQRPRCLLATSTWPPGSLLTGSMWTWSGAPASSNVSWTGLTARRCCPLA